MIQIEDEATLMQISEMPNKKVSIELIDIIGESSQIIIDYEQAMRIITFLNDVYTQPNQA